MMKRLALIVCFALVVGIYSIPKANSDTVKDVKRFESLRRTSLIAWKMVLTKLEFQVKSKEVSKNLHRRVYLKRKIKATKRLIEGIEKTGIFWNGFYFTGENFSLNDVGFFDFRRVDHLRVIQIMGDGEMLVRPDSDRGHDIHEPFILLGASTLDVVDGQRLNTNGLFEVVGKRRYVSVIGSEKTVYEIKWYGRDTIKAYIERYKEQKSKKKKNRKK